jgi:hypothetical protein
LQTSLGLANVARDAGQPHRDHLGVNVPMDRDAAALRKGEKLRSLTATVEP